MPEEKQDFSLGRLIEIFIAFALLGLSSFGGPVAHLGYFHTELVLRRRWLGEAAYGDVVALCQFLPGPASSQVCFLLGLMRAGRVWGGVVASLAFTLPSALLMLAFALGLSRLEGPLAAGLLHGLKLVAVAIVAQAVWSMARALTPDRPRAGIALAAIVCVTVLGGAAGQILALLMGAAAGLWLCPRQADGSGAMHPVPVSRRQGAAALIAALALLVLLPLLAAASGDRFAALASTFYRAGALVFGGGHVVLPLLEAAIVPAGWVSAGDFLAGYGLAQAVPGPLFTFAAYLGALAAPPGAAVAGAAVALVAIFLPGLLLAYGALPFWHALRTRPGAQAALRGANAAVVGVLGAALYSPVWTSAVMAPLDFALVVAGFLALTVWRAPPWAVVALLAAAGLLTTF